MNLGSTGSFLAFFLDLLRKRSFADNWHRIDWLIDWVSVLCPTRHKRGHFGDVLPSSQPIFWRSIEETKLKRNKETAREQNGKNIKKQTKTNSQLQELLLCVYVSLCTTVVHNTAQNSSDNLPSYPPDNHHCSDVVHWSGGQSVYKCIAMHRIVRYAELPPHRCHSELTVTSIATAETIAGTHCAYQRRMARLSWPGWLVSTPRRYSFDTI